MRLWLAILGALTGALGAFGVALAAYGAHRSADPTVTTAAHFALFHAAALVGFCGIIRTRPTPALLVAASAIAAGTILFSGDLALRAVAHVTPVRMAAPTGGTVLIIGWSIAAVALPIQLRRT